MPGNGLFTQRDDLEELQRNVLEAALLYFEDIAKESGIDPPTTARFALHFVLPAAIAA
jgi:predicted RNase H-like HicB family nuclease